MTERIQQQIEFVREIDRLKQIMRRSYLMDASRHENDAEHSWHIAVMALLLEEHAAHQDLNMTKVLHLLLIHDLVEIDAGDTFAYDAVGYEDKWDRELAAAKRIYSILPPDQQEEWMSLWLEFEEGATKEAKYAVAMDRLQPVLHNFYTEGKAWRENQVSASSVRKRLLILNEVSPSLATYASDLIDTAVEKGYLLP